MGMGMGMGVPRSRRDGVCMGFLFRLNGGGEGVKGGRYEMVWRSRIRSELREKGGNEVARRVEYLSLE